MSTNLTDLPVVVIGAGPVGLAAATHLVERALPFQVLEAGDQPGAAVRAWGHVRIFSPWRYNLDEAARPAAKPTRPSARSSTTPCQTSSAPTANGTPAITRS